MYHLAEILILKLLLFNYATKADFNNITHNDTSGFAWKTNLTNLKTEVDKVDIDKIVPVPVDLIKLSNVKNHVVKKTAYYNLAGKGNNIDTSRFLLKTKYDTDKLKLEKKIPDVSNIVKKSDYNTNVSEREGKIPSITGLGRTSALTAVENFAARLAKANLVTKE